MIDGCYIFYIIVAECQTKSISTEIKNSQTKEKEYQPNTLWLIRLLLRVPKEIRVWERHSSTTKGMDGKYVLQWV